MQRKRAIIVEKPSTLRAYCTSDGAAAEAERKERRRIIETRDGRAKWHEINARIVAASRRLDGLWESMRNVGFNVQNYSFGVTRPNGNCVTEEHAEKWIAEANLLSDALAATLAEEQANKARRQKEFEEQQRKETAMLREKQEASDRLHQAKHVRNAIAIAGGENGLKKFAAAWKYNPFQYTYNGGTVRSQIDALVRHGNITREERQRLMDILHRIAQPKESQRPKRPARGFIDDLEKIEFEEERHGRSLDQRYLHLAEQRKRKRDGHRRHSVCRNDRDRRRAWRKERDAVAGSD